MKKLLFLITIFISLNLSIYSQEKGWVTIKKDGFSIDYPNNWELDDSGIMNSSLLLYSPVTSADEQSRENINVIVQDLTGYDLDLDKYTKLSEDQIKTMFKDSKLIVSERVNNENLDFQNIIYIAKQGGLELKFKQRYWVINNKAYVMTYTAEVADFDNYITTVEKIFDSFKLN